MKLKPANNIILNISYFMATIKINKHKKKSVLDQKVSVKRSAIILTLDHYYQF